MESLTSVPSGDIKTHARLLRAALLKTTGIAVNQTIESLEQFERWYDTDAMMLTLYVRSCVSSQLNHLDDPKTIQAAYRFLFAVDDEIGTERVISVRALSSGARHGTHVLYDISSGSIPQVEDTGPIVVIQGTSTNDAIDVRDAVARLRAQHPNRRFVAFLGGQSEIDALAKHNAKFAVTCS